MKNILAENMRRFGTKNLMPLHESTLSDDDILDIIMTYTKDPDAAEAALANYRETGDYGDASIESNVTRDPRWTGSESDSDNNLPRDIQFVKDEMEKLIKHIKLKFSKFAGSHLYETPISDNQKIGLSRDGFIIVEDLVTDDMELRFWIRAFGDSVEVLKPIKLRKEFQTVAKRMSKLYE